MPLALRVKQLRMKEQRQEVEGEDNSRKAPLEVSKVTVQGVRPGSKQRPTNFTVNCHGKILTLLFFAQ